MLIKIAFGNVRRSVRDYAVYFVTLVLSISIFYAFNALSQQSTVLNLTEQQSQNIQSFGEIIGALSLFVVMIFAFLIVYANRFLIRRRTHEFGTYLMLGMSKSSVALILSLEAFFVGIASLFIGLFLGFMLSQGLLYVTALFLNTTLTQFSFMFSLSSCEMTLCCFALIFVFSLLLNLVTVSRHQLIDLIKATRTNEIVRFRSLPACVIMFIASLLCLGYAYSTILSDGIANMSSTFLIKALLICVGTGLLFFGLSGVLLRFAQMCQSRYLRGLNAFITRQLTARISTAAVSITMVSLTLFLALSATCDGIFLCNSFNNSIAANTRYDITFRAVNPARSLALVNPNDPETAMYLTPAVQNYLEQHALHTAIPIDGSNPNLSMALAAQQAVIEAEKGSTPPRINDGITQVLPQWSDLIRSYAQVDFYDANLTLSSMVSTTSSSTNISETSWQISNDYSLQLTSLSQLNNLRALNGEEALDLDDHSFLIWNEIGALDSFYQDFLSQHQTITQSGIELTHTDAPIISTPRETTSLASNGGTIVVSDNVLNEIVDQGRILTMSLCNAMYVSPRQEVDQSIHAMLTSTFGSVDNDTLKDSAPYTFALSAQEYIEQGASSVAMTAFLAMYIGFTLLIACAAILAIQQLSEAADTAKRFALLQSIGVSRSNLSKALFKQIGFYFILPLIPAILHTIVSLAAMSKTLEMISTGDVTGSLLWTAAILLVVYGGYFVITFIIARGFINPRQSTGRV
ncbi:MAG: ABC transporter permease [Eggerthellaceae bacterium]|jgi:putative ABC transport system permease protein|nr:ABC transporter permease [Eggerthellaceae bacterium]